MLTGLLRTFRKSRLLEKELPCPASILIRTAACYADTKADDIYDSGICPNVDPSAFNLVLRRAATEPQTQILPRDTRRHQRLPLLAKPLPLGRVRRRA